MNANDYWVIEYCFWEDGFSIWQLSEYLEAAQSSFHEKKFFGRVVLAIHPNEQAARDECKVWQERRNSQPMTTAEQLAEMRQHVAGLESVQAAEEGQSGS